MSSFKTRLTAFAAGAVIVTGTAVIATAPAHGESPSCGGTCADFFSYGPGSTPGSPSYLLDSYKQAQGTGNPLILFATNNTDPAQDFTIQTPEPLSDFYQAGLVLANIALHYGCMPGVNFAQCTDNGGDGTDDYAFEIQYAPFGAPTGQCAGLAATASSGEKVTLQPCGQSGKTLWIFDSPCYSTITTTSGGVVTGGTPSAGCRQLFASWTSFVAADNFPLLNGSDTTFSDPEALSYPDGASPLAMPRVSLDMQPLTVFSNGYGFPNGDVNDNQLWGARLGEATP